VEDGSNLLPTTSQHRSARFGSPETVGTLKILVPRHAVCDLQRAHWWREVRTDDIRFQIDTDCSSDPSRTPRAIVCPSTPGAPVALTCFNALPRQARFEISNACLIASACPRDPPRTYRRVDEQTARTTRHLRSARTDLHPLLRAGPPANRRRYSSLTGSPIGTIPIPCPTGKGVSGHASPVPQEAADQAHVVDMPGHRWPSKRKHPQTLPGIRLDTPVFDVVCIVSQRPQRSLAFLLILNMTPHGRPFLHRNHEVSATQHEAV